MKINKALKTLIVGAMCLSMTLGAAACTDNNPPKDDYQHTRTDMDTRPVTVAIGNLDQNFNPFFYTAQNDGEVTGMTQISMLSVDENGNPTCGQDEPTVVQAYKETVKGSGATQTTEYELVIKNGIKFSDGVDLTIKDVLFNLYVYLDPMYSGSSTLYATKIKGLNAYRSQNPSASDVAADNSDAAFTGPANTRISNLVNADDASGTQATDWSSVSTQMKADIITVANEFKKELTSDWNNNRGTVSSYKDTYQFTQDWEVFLFNEGQIGYEYYDDTNTHNRRRMTTEGYDADDKMLGKYVTTIDLIPERYGISRTEGLQYDLRREIEGQLKGLEGDELEETMRDVAIDTVFKEYFYVEENEKGEITYAEPATRGRLIRVMNEFATGTNVRQEFLNQERSKYFDDLRAKGELPVKSISGITIDKTDSSKFTGEGIKGSPLEAGQEYDVLKIVINGIDPVAIYNFGFSVSPMHYYSGTVGGIDYIDRCNKYYTNANMSDRFGVPYASNEFFTTVLNAPEKTAKPMGAGAYMVRNDLSRVLQGKDCLYERNEYFTTVGSGIDNAKLKYFTYCSRTEDQLINTLTTGGVDFGMPNCTPENIKQLAGYTNIAHGTYDAGGFGYVGINPKYVPEVGVRQAIMKAMNVKEITKTYYTEEYSSVIYRPISKTSWVYSEASDVEKDMYFEEYVNKDKNIDLRFTTDHDEIIRLVEDAGYTKFENGVRVNDNGDKLKYTFTIAGETTDHPAFAMFKRAETFLTECGFEITVTNDLQALQKLATGSLAVWAAAWSSGVDPDMYQVYHSASKASSVKNWGYDVIIENQGGKYDYESGILSELDEKIMQARSLLKHEQRRPYYYQALDLVMDLAIELPTYQRKDLYVYNTNVIRKESLNIDDVKKLPNANSGILARIWELDYV